MPVDFKIKTDEELVDLCLAGESDAFGILVERFQTQAYQLAFRYTGNRETAKDAVQEAFIRAYKSLGRFRKGSKFYTWLYRIVINICIDIHRKRSKGTLVSLEENMGVAEQSDGGGFSKPPERSDIEAERRDTAHRVRKEIDTLPEEQRLTIVLHSLQGLSREEIASIMKCPVETVKSRLSLARKKLRDKLKYLLL